MSTKMNGTGVCGWLVVSLLATGCATSAPAKSSSTHVPSLASTLGSVQAAGKAEGPQPKQPNPSEGARLFRSALQQLDERNTQQALQLFQQSAEADPNQPATHNNLGILYKQTGQLDKAVDAYKQAIAHQAVYPDAYYNLALTYRAQGQFKEAEAAYLKALAQNGQFADAHYNLGILYELYLGQPAKALEQYQAYLRLNGPHTKDVSAWASTLERVVPKSAQPPAPSQAPSSPPPASENRASASPQTGTVPPASSPAQPPAQIPTQPTPQQGAAAP